MIHKALVVLSGGQDSTTCLFWAIKQYGSDNVTAITFDYGQRHHCEISAACIVSEIAGVDHSILTIPCSHLLSVSPLVSGEPLPQYQDYDSMVDSVGTKVEVTFVPMRNVLFLTLAINRAVALGCRSVVIGVSQEDSANYPDCSKAFTQAYQIVANQALPEENRVVIDTPLIDCTKAETVRLMRSLGKTAWNALAYTHTSYDGKYPPTDMNHANILRAKGFEEAGYMDPLIFRAVREGLMRFPDTANYTGTGQ